MHSIHLFGYRDRNRKDDVPSAVDASTRTSDRRIFSRVLDTRVNRWDALQTVNLLSSAPFVLNLEKPYVQRTIKTYSREHVLRPSAATGTLRFSVENKKKKRSESKKDNANVGKRIL